MKESEAVVGELREEERVVRGEVEEKVDETRRLEQSVQELTQRHSGEMAEHKSAAHTTRALSKPVVEWYAVAH